MKMTIAAEFGDLVRVEKRDEDGTGCIWLELIEDGQNSKLCEGTYVYLDRDQTVQLMGALIETLR